MALPEEYKDMIEPEFHGCYDLCRPYTMTSKERMYVLFNAIHFIIKARIPGDFVECGVWKGGSVMMIAATLKSMGITDRTIYLYDTFDGMTPPTDADIDWKGNSAKDLLMQSEKKADTIWVYVPIDEVRTNLEKTGYPMDKFKFVRGDVLQTIPENAPEKISLLRLDTDWYESTRHELEHLFPRLSDRGILILDDYGYHQGSRKAVDEYFAKYPNAYYPHRIDSTARCLIKA